MKTCSSPTRSCPQLGQRLEHVARDQVKAARPRPQGDLPLDPHARLRYPGGVHVHLLAAERDALGLQQRALAGALGQRAVGAHDPPPRERPDRRRGRARCRRSAARRGRRRRRCARTPRAPRRTRCRARARRPRVCAMRHGTYSIVALDERTGRAGRRGAVALVLGRAAVRLGARRRRRGGDAVGGRARLRPERARPALGARQRPAGPGRAAGRRPAGRRAPGRGDRRARDDRHAHRPGLHRARRPRRRRAPQLPGQHDGPRHRAAGDVGRVRERHRPALRAPADAPSTPPRARAATSAGASRRRW